MRAILPLYLTEVLHFTATDAAPIYSGFKMAVYLLPLLGGFLADRYFGKYWTIVGFSIPYVIGQFFLCIPDQSVLLFALILLACGSGVIKPNISTLMGLTYDQQRPGQTALRSSAFMWFYFSINIGATLSLFALPEIRDRVYNSTCPPAVAYPQFATDGLGLDGQLTAFGTMVFMKAAERAGDGPLAYRVAFLFPAIFMIGSLLAFALGKNHYAVE